MWVPKSLTAGAAAFLLASLPHSTSVMPPRAASITNFLSAAGSDEADAAGVTSGVAPAGADACATAKAGTARSAATAKWRDDLFMGYSLSETVSDSRLWNDGTLKCSFKEQGCAVRPAKNCL